MKASYLGPLRHEPLAVELHNTLYAVRGESVDGLETAEGLGAWLDAIADRLPSRARDVDGSRHAEFLALRGAVRDALRAAVEGTRIPSTALEVINGAAAGAPASPLAVVEKGGRLRAETRYHTADATDIALAALAADAIELLSGDRGVRLHRCRAPGCVLMFVEQRFRQRWCSAACGNRARQARHYERVRSTRRST